MTLPHKAPPAVEAAVTHAMIALDKHLGDDARCRCGRPAESALRHHRCARPVCGDCLARDVRRVLVAHHSNAPLGCAACASVLDPGDVIARPI